MQRENSGLSTNLNFTTIEEQLKKAKRGNVTEWLVYGKIIESGATMIYSPPGCGKGLVALDLALSAAEGRNWLGKYEISEQPVIYVDEDGNNDRELNTRLLSFKAQPNPNLTFALHNGFKITDADARGQLITRCQKLGARLVIMDSLARLHDLTESSASDMKQVSRAIKEFTLKGISVVMLHHSARRGNIVRGSSEIETAYDCIYRMDRLRSNEFALINMKARSVGSNGEIWSGCSIVVDSDESGKLTLTATDIDEHHSGWSAPTSKHEHIRDGVLEALSDGGEMTETAISTKLKLSSRDKDVLKDVLAELQAEDLIDFEKRGKGRYFWLNDEDVVYDNPLAITV